MPRARYPTYHNVNATSLAIIERDAVSAYNNLAAISAIQTSPSPQNKFKTARGVKFTGGLFPSNPNTTAYADGLWYYIHNGNDICVYGNATAVSAKVSNNKLTLTYEDMPYEVLIDNTGKEYPVTRYSVEPSMIDESIVDGENVATMVGLLSVRSYDNKPPYPWNSRLLLLTHLIVQNWTNHNIKDMSSMFHGLVSLTKLTLTNFDTNSVTTMKRMFSGCGFLSSLNLSSFNTNKVTDMSTMFSACARLESLDLSRFNTEKVANMTGMFESSNALTSLTLGENFTIISGEDNDTYLAPDIPCEITMNNASYTVLKERELKDDYTLTPGSWTSSTALQTFIVTPVPRNTMNE